MSECAGVQLPGECVFPFTYEGVTYDGCTTANWPDNCWCSHSAIYIENNNPNDYSECTTPRPTNQPSARSAAPTIAPTTCGNAQTRPKCQPSFYYEGTGKTYTGCTNVDRNGACWCSWDATISSFSNRWDYCEISPTKIPTKVPSLSPSKFPSKTPISSQSVDPTLVPTFSPSKDPTASPLKQPTFNPSKSPTSFTGNPSKSPSRQPSNGPTIEPTFNPTVPPTVTPVVNPTPDVITESTSYLVTGNRVFTSGNVAEVDDAQAFIGLPALLWISGGSVVMIICLLICAITCLLCRTSKRKQAKINKNMADGNKGSTKPPVYDEFYSAPAANVVPVTAEVENGGEGAADAVEAVTAGGPIGLHYGSEKICTNCGIMTMGKILNGTIYCEQCFSKYIDDEEDVDNGEEVVDDLAISLGKDSDVLALEDNDAKLNEL